MTAVILVWLFCAAIGAAIAVSKNRHWSEGLLLGLVLGVIGVIIELFFRPLPKAIPGPPPPGWYPDPAGTGGGQRYWDGRAYGAAGAPQAGPQRSRPELEAEAETAEAEALAAEARARAIRLRREAQAETKPSPSPKSSTPPQGRQNPEPGASAQPDPE